MRLRLDRLRTLLEPGRHPRAVDAAVEQRTLTLVNLALDALRPLIRPHCLHRGITRYVFVGRAGAHVSWPLAWAREPRRSATAGSCGTVSRTSRLVIQGPCLRSCTASRRRAPTRHADCHRHRVPISRPPVDTGGRAEPARCACGLASRCCRRAMRPLTTFGSSFTSARRRSRRGRVARCARSTDLWKVLSSTGRTPARLGAAAGAASALASDLSHSLAARAGDESGRLSASPRRAVPRCRVGARHAERAVDGSPSGTNAADRAVAAAHFGSIDLENGPCMMGRLRPGGA